MADFSIAHLESETLEEAWPLVHAAAPEISCPAWLGFGERLIAEGGGILGARSPDGQFHGLAAYRIEDRLRGGLTLKVDTLITFDLHHRAPVRRALIDALVAIGRAFGCANLSVTLPSRGHAEAGEKSLAWLALGLGLESVLLTRGLPRPAPG